MTGIIFRDIGWMRIPRTSHQNQCNGRTKFTNERDLQLAKLVHTEKWWLTALHGHEKAASEWLCNEPLLIQFHAFFNPVKKAKVKAVQKVRNKDLVLPLMLWMALLGQFRKAENITGSSNETAGCWKCRSPLELCSMWSLRVTSFAQQARRRRRVGRGVDQNKTEKMSAADSVQYRDLLWCTILWRHGTSC